MKTIALYHIKGGVGKTAAAVNLSYLSAAASKRTLLCDLDPQGASSFYFRIKPSGNDGRKALLKGGRHLAECVKGTDYDLLDLLPSSLSFRHLDIALDGKKRSKMRLRESLLEFEEEYDVVFLDCPPNVTLLSENIFHAADILLVPLIPTTLSFLTFQRLMEFFEGDGPDPSSVHPFISMFERKKKLHLDMCETLTRECHRLLPVRIPYASDVEKMGLSREPVCASSPKCPASLAYAELWQHVSRMLFPEE